MRFEYVCLVCVFFSFFASYSKDICDFLFCSGWNWIGRSFSLVNSIQFQFQFITRNRFSHIFFLFLLLSWFRHQLFEVIWTPDIPPVLTLGFFSQSSKFQGNRMIHLRILCKKQFGHFINDGCRPQSENLSSRQLVIIYPGAMCAICNREDREEKMCFAFEEFRWIRDS